MKILLAVKSKKMENLGVMYLSAVAKKGGHECRIVTFEEVSIKCASWKPDIIGFSVMTGDQELVKKNIKKLKQKNFHQIIVGGPHPTFFPDDFKNIGVWIAKGEAENWIAEFLGGPIGMFPTIDSLPWPDRTDFPNMPIRDFITSRGCPYNCSYCYNDRWAKMFPDVKRVRTRSVQDVIAEVKAVKPRFAYFQDSCFAVSTKWLREFSHPFSHLMIPYHCHMRPSQITPERVELLKHSNCYSLRIALETASDRLRKLIGREKTTNEETIQAARLLKKWDIKLMIQNILGLPESTIEDDLETLEVNIRCHPAYGWCSIFQPYPGTALADYCIENGIYKGNFSEITDCFFDGSLLEFDEEHKEQVKVLQRVFALCCETRYVPTPSELTEANLPQLIHKIMRSLGDKRLYGGVI